MGYFLPEAVWSCAKVVGWDRGSGSRETASHHSHARMHLLPNRKTLLGEDHARITCRIFLNAMNTCKDSQGESQWTCEASGCLEENLESLRAKQWIRMCAAPIACCSSSGTCGLTDEPHRSAGTSQNLSCTVHHVRLFLASQIEAPKCHVPRLYPHLGKDLVWETCMQNTSKHLGYSHKAYTTIP